MYQVKDYHMASVEEYIGDSGKEFEVWIHIAHSLLITREGLILTLSIHIILRGWI